MLLHAHWEDVVFLHFVVETRGARARVPAPLRLDLPLGEAWITLVALRSRGPAPLPAPLVGAMPAVAQLGVRGYVEAEGEPALYYFDEWVASSALVAAGRLMGLVRRAADVRVRKDGDDIRVHLDGPAATGARLEARVRIAGPTQKAMRDPVGRALLERYLGFAGTPPRWFRFEHAPWIIQPLAVEELEWEHLLPEGARLAAAHYGTPLAVASGVSHAVPRAHPETAPLAEPVR